MIEDIREKASQFDWQNIDAVIDFYDENHLYFDDYETLADLDTIIDVITIKSHYLKALIKKSRYTKALTYINHVDYLLEKIKDRSDKYESLRIRNLFQKGAIYGYLKRYKPSAEIFAKLIQIDSENDLYKDWYLEMRTKLVFKKIRIVGFFGFAVVFADAVSGLVFKYRFDSKIVLFGCILMLISFLIPVGAKYLSKRIVSRIIN